MSPAVPCRRLWPALCVALLTLPPWPAGAAELGASVEGLLAHARAQSPELAAMRAEADAASDAVTAEIANNLELARALGFTGTPAWIAGLKPIGGAVGYERLKAALAESAPG